MKSMQRSKRLLQLAAALFLTLGCVFAFQLKTEAAITAPTEVCQTGANSGQVQVEWKSVLGTNGEQIYYYLKYSDTVNFSKFSYLYPQNCSYVISGLDAGKDYYVQVGVSSTNQLDQAPADTQWSSTLKVSTAPSGTVKSVQQTKATATSVSASWKKVTGATAYKVLYFKTVAEGTEPKASAIKQKTVTTNSITLSNVTKNSLWDVYVYPVRFGENKFEAIGSGYGWVNLATQPTKKVTGLDCSYFDTSVKKGEADFSWNHITFAGYIMPDGYQWEIYKYNGGKKLAAGTTTKNYVTVKNKNLKKRQYYKIRIRPYVQLANKQKKFGSWSDWDYFARCAGSDVTKKLVSSSDTKVKLTWKKVDGAQSYTVYWSKSQNGKYTKLGKVKGTSYTINKNIPYYTNYYIRIVPNRKVGKKTYTGVINGSNFYSTSFYIKQVYY